jgi:hypothetical protein
LVIDIKTWGVGTSWHICQDPQGSQTLPIMPSHAK